MKQRISDSILDNPQRWALAVFVCALAFVALVDARPAIQAWGRAPQQLAALQAAVEQVPGQIAGQSLTQLVPLIDKHAGLVRRDLFGEVTALRVETAKQVAGLRGDVMPLAYAALGVVNQARGDAVRQIEGVRGDLKPTLDNTAALVKDAQDSWDDSYWEVKAMVESATVFTTSGALAAESVAKEVPALSKAATSTASSVAGIMGDAHAWTDKNVRPHPMTLKEKVAAFFKVALAIAIAALRGGAF